MCRKLVLIILTLSLVSCVTVDPPREEYSLAKAAIEAAKAVQAVRYSPGHWHQADEYYRQATILFKEREYAEARELFLLARRSAEKAENSARLLRQKNGDIL